MGAFEKETVYRLLTEACRMWVVSTHLETGKLPKFVTYWVYGNGAPINIGWGDAGGPPSENTPMRGKRIRVTLEVEDG